MIHELPREERTVHGYFSPELQPVVTVRPGDTIRFQALNAGWRWFAAEELFERDRELHRFEKGATASSARELFKTEMAATVLPQLAKLVVPGKPAIEVVAPGDIAEVVLPDGGRVRFARGDNGGWGFAGFTPDAEARKNRAYHDLEQVRTNAADYERAAARGAR